MAREFFINPYTFIPLEESGPLLRPTVNEYAHLFFDDKRFTGIIEAELIFVTPAVIPGKQEPGSRQSPGRIEAYRYGDRLAIPGSRIRGNVLNLMRAINSSPITQFQDWNILRREEKPLCKGVIIQCKDGLKVRRIDYEILVKHPSRSGGPRLDKGCTPHDRPEAYNGGRAFDIPNYPDHFNGDGTAKSLPRSGDLYWQYVFEKGRANKYKMYLATHSSGTPVQDRGQWVKFPSWSGQDGQNQLKDQSDIAGAHRNAWHVVKTAWITANDYELPQAVIEKCQQDAKRAADLLEERGEDASVLKRVREELGALEPGMFVYFLPDASGSAVRTIGRHYRYLVYLGSVKGLIDSTHNALKVGSADMVRGLAGYAKERGGEGLKGRLWVEMALGPQWNSPGLLEEKALRILSSQPPKSKNFYLKGGDYGSPSARARGRKFYWNDPFWKEKKWDNEDLNGDMGFENPTPDNPELYKQWHRAEILMASEDKPVAFSFKIRFMNLSKDEFYLLVTALVGFELEVSNGCLGRVYWKKWCHKIGHARPFLGSAYLKLKGVSLLDFVQETLEPRLEPRDLGELIEDIRKWQPRSLKGGHLDRLKRVMRFEGAREALSSTPDFVPITYPLGQNPKDARHKGQITWLDSSGTPFYRAKRDEKEPKIYTFFSTTRRGYTPPPLPDPKPGENQELRVYFDGSSARGGAGPGGGPGKRTKPKKGGRVHEE